MHHYTMSHDLLVFLVTTAIICAAIFWLGRDKKQIEYLLANGRIGEADIVGYKKQPGSDASNCIVVYKFTPEGRSAPHTYEKVVKSRSNPPPGINVEIRYSWRYAFQNILLPYGDDQTAFSKRID